VETRGRTIFRHVHDADGSAEVVLVEAASVVASPGGVDG